MNKRVRTCGTPTWSEVPSVDHLTAAERSENMRRIRGKNTQPELRVRKAIFALGYRYRLHYAALPGKPDLVFPAQRKAIFVHGCFWHHHGSCKYGRLPQTNALFWLEKLRNNAVRDKNCRLELRRIGWKSMVVWECQTRSIEKQLRRIREFLES